MKQRGVGRHGLLLARNMLDPGARLVQRSRDRVMCTCPEVLCSVALILISCKIVSNWIHSAMNILIRSSVFSSWLNRLKDQKAKARILHRLSQASLGNFGDCEPVGEGVSEMRIHHGPGFRVYFVRHGTAVYVLLCGGDKSSQRRDIAAAKRLAKELKENGQ